MIKGSMCAKNSTGGNEMRLKKSQGFTLIELVIVIIIIAILAIIAVPTYRNYTRRSMVAEGKSLVGAVATAQKLYYTEHSAYFGDGSVPYTGVDAAGVPDILGIDCRANKYFIHYWTSNNGTSGLASTFNIDTGAVAAPSDAAGLQVLLQTASPSSPGTLVVQDAGVQMPGW